MDKITAKDVYAQEYDVFGKKITNQPVNSLLQGAIPNIANEPSNFVSLMSSQMTKDINNTGGVIYASKLSFTDTTSGYRLGIDKIDNTPKFYIGNASNSLKWDGTSLTIVGNISATTGSIGGFTIGATTLSGGSTLVLSSTGTGTITGGTIQTAATGLRVALLKGDTYYGGDMIAFMNGSTVYSRIYPNVFAGGNGIIMETTTGVSSINLVEGTTDQVIISSDLVGLTVDGINSNVAVDGGLLNVAQITTTGAAAMTHRDGSMYYDTTTGSLRVWIGGVLKTVTVA